MTYFNSRGEPMPETEAEQGRVAGTSAGNETMTAPDAPGSSVSGEGGGDLLIGSRFGNRFWITDTRDRVQEQAGGGVDVMIGWTSLKLAPNIENLQVNGNLNYAVGNELANLIVVDDTSHWVYGAGGDDVLVGGATQKTTFVVRAGEGSDVIYNWNGNSQVQFLDYGFKTPGDVRSAMSQVGSDVVLRLSATETLTFRDETLSSFADRQFLLPLDTSKLGGLTFSDEFDTLKIYDHSLQTGQWRADFGGNLMDEWAYTLTSNGERQVYTKPGWYGQGERDLDYNPFSVSNGVLTIKAERLEQHERDAAWGREYSSGMLNTLGMFEQKYGYFEMRAELPTAVGAWPAFWMMPSPYVAQVEADIMEGLAITPHVDYRRAWGGGDNLYDNAYKIDPTGFHTYGMLWTPTTVTFYFDGVAVLQAPTPGNWTEPMSMIVNMAVGGWGGEPDERMFPAEMKIDYVRAYNLSDNSAVIERGTPEPPAATLRADGGPTSGHANVTTTFEATGQPVSSAKIAVYDAKPGSPPPGKTFVIWEDAGAVFGAVSDGTTIGQGTALMAGDSRTFTGSGTWLSDGKVALAYMMPDDVGQAAWVMIFDPAKNTFTRHELGPSTGDIDIIATKNGGFAASWDAPGGTVMGRAYDGFAYGGKGFYGPERQLAGDLTGVTASGELIATTASGQQQLYDMINPPPAVNAVISIGPMAGVSHTEGHVNGTLYTFTLIRDWDQGQKSTVGWQVRGQGANPADALDFVGGVMPSGVATFEVNQTTAYVQVFVQGDNYSEGNEEFLVTLVNPVGAKLGQATATGFITNDDAGGNPPPTGGTTTLGFSTASVTLAEGNSGSTAFSFTVTRSGTTTGASSVNYTVAGSGTNAASAADFTGGTLPSGSITFAAGETSKVVTVNVAGDTTVEASETFTVTLSGATGAAIGTATATGTISNDDGASGGSGQVITSPGPGSTLTGGAGNDTLNASQGADVLTGGAGADKFAFAALPWSAGRITDFAVGSDKLDFSGIFQSSGYSGADPVADGRMRFESDGSGGTKIFFDRDAPNTGDWPFHVTTLQGVSPTGLTWAQLSTGGTTQPPPTGTPQIAFSTPSASLAEGNSGTTAFTYTLTRTGPTTGTSSVNWTVSGDGTYPANGADFAGGALPSGTVTFAAGESSKTITVNVAGDTTFEDDNGFKVVLSNASGATLGTASTATGLIRDDDIQQVIRVRNGPQGGEGNSGTTAYTFEVLLEGNGPGLATVDWAIRGFGTSPADASDFAGGVLPSGRINLTAGLNTITVQVAGDTTAEPDERFELVFSNPTQGTRIENSGVGFIANDDGAPPPPPSGGQVINSPGPGSTLTGGAGNDTLNASQGADVLTGGAGADKFAYSALPWSAGRITDFAVGSDKLDFSGIFQSSGYSGADPVADGRMRFESDGSGGTKIFFDRDAPNTGDWPFLVTTLQGVSPTGLTWAQLSTGGTSQPPPPPPGPQVGFAATSVTVAEGDGGSTAFAFTLTRTGSTTGASSVNWTTAGSGSNPATGSDFGGGALPSGTVTFAAGETSKTITLNVMGDSQAEPDETFTVTLSGASGATLGAATATGTITDDDGATPPPPTGGDGQVITSPGPGSRLTGTANNDTLVSSQGSDILTGGSGADHFVFAKENWSPAEITDFERGIDKIDLRGLFDAIGYNGTDPFADGYLKLLGDGADTKVLFDRDAGGPTPEWPNYILKIDGVTPSQLTPSDWLFQ